MIVNAPTGNTIAAAEHTMALMLALLRRVPDADASVRAGEWDRGRYTGRELRGKTLGIIGLGKIGRGGRPTRDRLRDARHRLRSVPDRGAGGRGRCEAGRDGGAPASVRRHHRPHAADRPDPPSARPRPAGGDETRCLRAQRGARRHRGRVGPRRCARLRPPRRRRGGRLLDRADGARQPAARRPEPRAHAAPRRLDRRGAGSRRRWRWPSRC